MFDPIEKSILRETSKLLQAILREHMATDAKGRRTAKASTLRTMAENIQKKANRL